MPRDKHSWQDILQTLSEGGMGSHPGIALARDYYFTTGDPGELQRFLEENPHILAAAQRNIAYRNWQLSNLPFKPPTRREVAEKLSLSADSQSPGVSLGVVNAQGDNFVIDPVRVLPTHAIALGPPGSGKSHYFKWLVSQFLSLVQKFNVIIPDIKGEYRDLAARHKNLFVVTPDLLIINPWEVPHWRDPLDHIIAVAKSFVSSNYLAGTSLNLLIEILEELYRQLGVFAGSQNYPTYQEVYDAVDRRLRTKKASHIWNVCEWLKNRLLPYTINQNFQYRKGIPFEYFLERNLVLEMHHGFSDMVAAFITTHISEMLYSYHTQMRHVGSRLRHLMLVDECRLLFAERNTENFLENPLVEITSRSREIGLGFWAASQEASSFHHSLVSLARVKIAFPASSDQDLNFIQNALVLNEDQVNYLLKLPGQRAAVCRYSGYPEPFLIQVPVFDL